VRFRKTGGFFANAPDRGEILISTDPNGETQVECRVWCWTLIARWLLVGCGVGLLVGGLAVLAGSTRSTAIGAGLVVAAVWNAAAWLIGRSRLRRQIEAFLHNTTYLKAF